MDAPAAPVLAEQTAPGPGVEILFSSIDDEAATITVWRLADGQRETVRRGSRAIVVGAFAITDWEVPFGVPVTYFAEIFDAGGASVTGLPSTIQVDRDAVHISNPIDPSQVYVVPSMQFGSRSFETLATPRDRKLVYVVGVPRPFAQDWGVGALEQVPFSVTTDDESQARAFHELLAAPQLLIRTPPTPFTILPRLLYASVAVPTAIPRDWIADGGSILWQLVLDEVQPIAKAVMRPLITWADWAEAFPPVQDVGDPQEGEYLWGDVYAIFAAGTWLDLKRNPFNA